MVKPSLIALFATVLFLQTCPAFAGCGASYLGPVARRTWLPVGSDRTMALFPSKRIVLVTLTPKAASTDFWATTAAQTTSDLTDEASRIKYNTSVRAKVARVGQFSEIADVVESSRNSGVWKAPGATADGIHPKPSMYQTLIGSTNVAWFKWP